MCSKKLSDDTSESFLYCLEIRFFNSLWERRFMRKSFLLQRGYPAYLVLKIFSAFINVPLLEISLYTVLSITICSHCS